MACITRRLVIVQYDLSVRIHLTSTIHPHVMPIPIGSVFFWDLNQSPICLKHMIIIELLMQIIIKDWELSLPFGLVASSSAYSSSEATASASLKKSMLPSTSIKQIWFSVSSFSEDLPKRLLFNTATCSNSNWSFQSISWSYDCWLRNSWTSVALS